jgi:outer membrane lipoprotein-sorting protein
MNCIERQEPIQKLVDDRLEKPVREELLRHMEDCPVCQALLEANLREPLIEEAVHPSRDTWPAVEEEHLRSVKGGHLPLRRRKAFRIAVAAAVVLILFALWFAPGERLEPNAAYAAMGPALQKIAAAQFTQTNPFGVETIHMQCGDGRWRREVSNPQGYSATAIYDGTLLAWFNPARKYVDLQRNPYGDHVPAPFWEKIRNKIDFENVVSKTFLGEVEIDGIDALGYDVTLRDRGAFTARSEEIWIDPATGLPLLVVSRSVFSYATLDEIALEREKARLNRLVRLGVWTQDEVDRLLKDNMESTKVVDTYHGFHWNPSLADSLFKIEVPSGWTSQER